jgi:hypothetical protein
MSGAVRSWNDELRNSLHIHRYCPASVRHRTTRARPGEYLPGCNERSDSSGQRRRYIPGSLGVAAAVASGRARRRRGMRARSGAGRLANDVGNSGELAPAWPGGPALEAGVQAFWLCGHGRSVDSIMSRHDQPDAQPLAEAGSGPATHDDGRSAGRGAATHRQSLPVRNSVQIKTSASIEAGLPRPPARFPPVRPA